ncbi:MAG: ATP-binding protein [Acidobacteria bacterium]|nr:ATP-binding protein [Acidobacteriota bacterium]
MTTMPTQSVFVPRVLDLRGLLAKKSHFLLGPRQTGKTTLIRHALPETPRYDLLETATWLALSQDPGRLAEELSPGTDTVVIDEIQRLPQLLNEVHRLIEERRVRFLLTGSSARALRRGGVNLLGGRARTRVLHPLTRAELGSRFDLERSLIHGTLPSILFSDDPRAALAAYAGTYLQPAGVFEGAARNLPAFSRFLRVAALANGQIVNFTTVASDAQVPRTTIYEYFEVLRDTLLLFEVPAWRRPRKRKPLVSSKFYFFDIGAANALAGRRPDPGTPEFGHAFEAWLLHELRTYCDYRAPQDLHFWRTASGYEVDFILGEHTAIEAKCKPLVSARDLRSLRALGEEAAVKRYVCVSLEPRPRIVDGIEVLPYGAFLDALWAGEYD